jgi:hypothetical protein
MPRPVDAGPKPGSESSTRKGSDRRTSWTLRRDDGTTKQVGPNHKGPGGHTPHDVLSA